ncbi:hypothetical protein H0X32_03885, partial [Patescibacteria group bacterium]|nr:hypothetical protein [Patescibacteria group bacterium]
KARARLFNAVIGLVIVLVAWLLIDSLMKVIYNSGSSFGPWNSILADSGDKCFIAKANPPPLPGLTDAANTSGGTGGTGPSVPGAGGTLPQNGTGACSASTVQSSAAAGGYNISSSEATILACLARPESACGQKTTGATTPGGQSTSASGPWQILLGAKDSCHSLNIPACGNLNCSAAYSGGHPKPDAQSQALAAQCQAAANNLTCSASAAACLIQANHGSYGAWTADPRSSTQKACVASGGG